MRIWLPRQNVDLLCLLVDTFHIFFQGAGHNDVELYSQYLERLKQFVSVELLNWQLLPPGEESEHNATSTVSSATTSSVTEKLL